MLLPVAGSLRVFDVINAIKDPLASVEGVRGQLRDRHCVKDERGQLVLENVQPNGMGTLTFNSDGDRLSYLASDAELLASEVEVPVAVRASDLGTAMIKPETILALGPLFDRGE